VWDAVVVPSGDEALATLGQAMEFVKDQYRHSKPLLLPATSALADAAKLPDTMPDGSPDPALLRRGGKDDAVAAFLDQVGGPRNFARETDPPRV